MSTTNGGHERAALRGADEWTALSDDLLAGLLHALNNRVTAMTACAELIALGDQQVTTDGLLSTEVRQLQQTCALLSLLPARNAPPEALELAPVLEDAMSLHAHHPHLRAIPCAIERSGVLQPVRAPRWALLRLLLLVVHAAKSSVAEQRQERATVYLSGDDARVTVRTGSANDVGNYAAAMAERCGAVLDRERAELTLTFPSLAEVRRRERGTPSPS